MIKKFIDKLLGTSLGAAPGGKKNMFGKRVEVPVQSHGIDPTLVDERANNVVRTLLYRGWRRARPASGPAPQRL
jgi:poly(A) polymerase